MGSGPPSLPLQLARSPCGLGAARQPGPAAPAAAADRPLAARAGDPGGDRGRHLRLALAGRGRRRPARGGASASRPRGRAATTPAMWRELTARAREATPERRFVTAYRNADREAGVEKVRSAGSARSATAGWPCRSTIETDIFGTLRGTIAVPVSGRGDEAGVDWDFSLRLPGLRRDEAVVQRAGRQPRRARCSPPTARRSTCRRDRRGLERMHETACRPSVGAAAVRRARGRAHARRAAAAPCGRRSTRG